MDERLDTGRHHLRAGDAAVHNGKFDVGRAAFDAALIQFRGPDLRLGEAHALRGLAQVELGLGQLDAAEARVRDAVACFRDVRQLLSQLDDTDASAPLRREARQGEGASLVLLGDVYLRSGLSDKARETLGRAERIFGELGQPAAAAGAWASLGRLAMREGRYDDAFAAFAQAASVHEGADDQAGLCAMWLARAELWLLQGAVDKAASSATEAQAIAQTIAAPGLEGRAMALHGQIYHHRQEPRRALDAMLASLSLLRKAGDRDMLAYVLLHASDVESQLGKSDSLQHLLEGTTQLAQLGNHHGVGAAMIRLAEHALRVDQPAHALLAAEAARRLWDDVDPVRGVGQALRLVVKSLAGVNQWRAAVAAAYARADVAGHLQPNAIAVRDWYRARSPKEWIVLYDDMDRSTRFDVYQRLVHDVIRPALAGLSLVEDDLTTAQGAIALVQAMLRHEAPPVALSEPEPLPDGMIEPLDADAPAPTEAGALNRVAAPPVAMINRASSGDAAPSLGWYAPPTTLTPDDAPAPSQGDPASNQGDPAKDAE